MVQNEVFKNGATHGEHVLDENAKQVSGGRKSLFNTQHQNNYKYMNKKLTSSSYCAQRDGYGPELKAKILKTLEEQLKEHLYDLVQKIFSGNTKSAN